MNKLSFILVAFLFPLALLAQNIDYKKIILPDDASNVTFEEKLVQLAWKNNPSTTIAREEYVISREEFKIKRAEWSTLFGMTGNLNEFNIREFAGASEATGGNQFFPRYNVYLRLPFSLLVENPHQKNAFRSRIKVAESKVNLMKLEIRNTVLKLYSEYKKAEAILIIKRQSVADEESNYLLVEEKFKNGDASVEEYIQAQRIRNDMKIQLVVAENDFRQAKLDVEQVIGVELDDVK